jgi:hypothetical protein
MRYMSASTILSGCPIKNTSLFALLTIGVVEYWNDGIMARPGAT